MDRAQSNKEESGPAMEEVRTNEETVSYLVQHQSIFTLLRLFPLEPSLRDILSKLNIKNSEDKIEMTGPKDLLQKFQKVLHHTDGLTDSSQDQFLANQNVQQSLKNSIVSLGYSLGIMPKDSCFVIETDKGQKKLEEFLQAEITKKIYDIPSEDQILETINKLSPFCHAYVVEDEVELLYLTGKKNEMEAIRLDISKLLKEKTSTVQQVSEDTSTSRTVSGKKSSEASNSIQHEHDKASEQAQSRPTEERTNLMLIKQKSSEAKNVDVISMRTQSNKGASGSAKTLERTNEKTVSSFFQHQHVLTLLKLLSLEQCAKDIGIRHMFIDDEGEVEMTGSKDILGKFQKLLHSIDNEVTNPILDKFLAGKDVQQSLKKSFDSLGCSLNIVQCDKQLCLVIRTDKEEKKLGDFLQSQVAKKVYTKPCEDKTLKVIESFHKLSPFCHAYVVGDEVEVLYLTSRQSEVKTVRSLFSKLLEEKTRTVQQVSEEASTSRTVSDKVSKRTVTIDFEHEALAWILSVFKFKEIEENKSVDIAIDEERGEKISISGPEEKVEQLKKIIVFEDRELQTLLEDEGQWFNSDNIKHWIKKFHEEKHYRCDIQQGSLHIIRNERETMTLTDFLKSLRDVMTSTSEFQTPREKNYQWSESTLTEVTAYDEKLFTSVRCPWQKQMYCKMFQSSSFAQILELCWKHGEKIFRTNDQVKVMGKHSEEIVRRLISLMDPVVSKVVTFQFPGLVPFLHTDGQKMLEGLEKQYKCFIELDGICDNNPLNLTDLGLPPEDCGVLRYEVDHLGTAILGNLHFHLIQGNLNRLQLDHEAITLEFKPKQNPGDECEIQAQVTHSVKQVYIHLPNWLSPESKDDPSYCRQLRWSLHKCMSTFMKNIIDFNHSVIAVSTSQLHCDRHKYSFPLDIIAKTLVSHMITVLRRDHFEAGLPPEVTHIYVCESENEAVIKAFRFYLEQWSAFFGPPDESSWDKVSRYVKEDDIMNYTEIQKSRNMAVEVNSSPKLITKALFCHPIAPTLEAATCLVSDIDRQSVKSSVKDLLRRQPDGLLDGESFRLKLFFSGKDAIVYCCPDWGWDCRKVLHESLRECLNQAFFRGLESNRQTFEAVYIIPPGTSGLSKYPRRFLAQTCFEAVDDFLMKTKLRGKLISFVIHDSSTAEIFQDELKRRCSFQSKGRESYRGNACNWWNYVTEGTGKYSAQADLRNIVSETKITFWSENRYSIDRAAGDMRKKLFNLMDKNVATITLNDQQMKFFQEELNTFQEIPVSINIIAEHGGKQRMKGKKGHPIKIYKVILNALSKLYIEDFVSRIEGLPEGHVTFHDGSFDTEGNVSNDSDSDVLEP